MRYRYLEESCRYVVLLLVTGPVSSAASQPATGLGQQQFSKDVEDEANSYFQRIYNTSGSSQHSAITIVEQVLEMLKNFKDSQSDRDKVRANSLSFSQAVFQSLPPP